MRKRNKAIKMIREWDLGHCCKRQGTVSWCVVPVGKMREQMVHVKELNRGDFSPCINKVTVKKTRIKDHSISITRETTDFITFICRSFTVTVQSPESHQPFIP